MADNSRLGYGARADARRITPILDPPIQDDESRQRRAVGGAAGGRAVDQPRRRAPPGERRGDRYVMKAKSHRCARMWAARALAVAGMLGAAGWTGRGTAVGRPRCWRRAGRGSTSWCWTRPRAGDRRRRPRHRPGVPRDDRRRRRAGGDRAAADGLWGPRGELLVRPARGRGRAVRRRERGRAVVHPLARRTRQPDDLGGAETSASILWSHPGDPTIPRLGYWNDLPAAGGYPQVESVYPDLVSRGYVIERLDAANPAGGSFENGDGDSTRGRAAGGVHAAGWSGLVPSRRCRRGLVLGRRATGRSSRRQPPHPRRPSRRHWHRGDHCVCTAGKPGSGTSSGAHREYHFLISDHTSHQCQLG